MKLLQLKLDQIRTNGGTQIRATINRETVTEYAEAIEDGAEFPAVVVFWDRVAYWLADGFHRLFAHLEAGVKTITCDVREGTLRDALLFAVGANAEPRALKRSREDKWRAVEVLLADPEWSQWSSREIARRCSVSDRFVGIVRDELMRRAAEAAGASANVRRRPKPTAPRKFSRGGKVLSQAIKETPEDEIKRRDFGWAETVLTDVIARMAPHGADRTCKTVQRALDALRYDRLRLLPPEKPRAA